MELHTLKFDVMFTSGTGTLNKNRG